MCNVDTDVSTLNAAKSILEKKKIKIKMWPVKSKNFYGITVKIITGEKKQDAQKVIKSSPN